MRLSVIIPAYNEVSTVGSVLRRVAEQCLADVELEVIVVDDGSTDGTGTYLESLPDLYSTLIRRPRNGGKGAAVRDALEVATGDYVLFQDADLEYDPVEYQRLLVPILAHHADVVIGSRMLAPAYVRVHYFWHLVGNKLLTLVFNALYNLTFTDIYSCYLLYRRSLLDPGELRSVGWEQHAEILCTVARRGRKIYEVPVSYAGRTYEEGKKIRYWHAIAVFWTIVRKRFDSGTARRSPDEGAGAI